MPWWIPTRSDPSADRERHRLGCSAVSLRGEAGNASRVRRARLLALALAAVASAALIRSTAVEAGGRAAAEPLTCAGPAAGSTATAPIQRPQPLQRHFFSVFRTAPERPPPAAEDAIRAILDGKARRGRGFNIALAQAARPPGNRQPLWAVPGRGCAMLFEWLPGRPALAAFFVASNRRAARSGITGLVPERGSGPATASAGREPRHYQAVGLVPDGVVAVRLGRSVETRVLDNVYSRRVARSELGYRPSFVRAR